MQVLTKVKMLVVAGLVSAVGAGVFGGDVGAVETAPDLARENLSGVSERDKEILKQDAEGKATIPYTRFWITVSSGQWLYARASGYNNGQPYIGSGGSEASIYESHPMNWRMIQVGSSFPGRGYRLIKNSHTGKCIAINQNYGLLMRTCDTGNHTQRLTIDYDQYNGKAILSINRLTGDGWRGVNIRGFYEVASLYISSSAPRAWYFSSAR